MALLSSSNSRCLAGWQPTRHKCTSLPPPPRHAQSALNTPFHGLCCPLQPPAAAQRRRSALLPAAAAAAPANLPPDFDPQVYLDALAEPQYFVGPIAAAHIPGKGRGLVATAPLSPGQLLLVVPPLALLEGELGDIPEHDELVEVISSSGALFTPWQAAWLKALTTTTAADQAAQHGTNSSSSSGGGGSSGGSSGSKQQQQQQQQQQPVVPEFLPPVGGETDRVLFESTGLDEERLWAAVVLNCYGEGFADLPASLCAAAPLSSQLGLWGPFSLLNHTCCPNVVNYTLRECMVVRCCAPIAAGEELSINYLGRTALTPLAQRQQELEACYGFKCDCRRCRAEAAWADVPTQTGTSLATFLDGLHARIGEELEPRRAQIMQDMQDAAEEGAAAAADNTQQHQQQLQQLVDDLQQHWQQLLAAAGSRAQAGSSSSTGGSSGSSTHALSSEEACWVMASAFDLLGLLHDSTQSLGQQDQGVQDAIVQVCEVVCPGSDLHVFQALIRTSLAQQAGAQSQAASDAAMQGLVRALQLRYGPQVAADPELLQKMVAATSAAANMVWL